MGLASKSARTIKLGDWLPLGNGSQKSLLTKTAFWKIELATAQSLDIRCYLANLCPFRHYVLNEVPRLVNDSFSHHSRTINVRMQGRCRMPVIVDQARGWSAGARPISNEKRKMSLSMRSEAIVLEHWPVY
jgi:hypothetical protein